MVRTAGREVKQCLMGALSADPRGRRRYPALYPSDEINLPTAASNFGDEGLLDSVNNRLTSLLVKSS